MNGDSVWDKLIGAVIVVWLLAEMAQFIAPNRFRVDVPLSGAGTAALLAIVAFRFNQKRGNGGHA